MAAQMSDQVDEEVREHRKEILEEQQDTRVAEMYDAMIGGETEVVVEGFDRYAELYFGRSAMFAPEIDGMIYFTAPNDKRLVIGQFVHIRFNDVLDNNLIGEVI